MKKYLADSLSGTNLLCGVVSIGCSAAGRFDLALLFVLLGALCDGLDGAAARYFGGTRFGVLADDLADGVSYGIAPGAALYFLLVDVQGLVLGILYALFTISRLVYFTFNKESSDPNYFAGVPSPTGGVIVMSAVVCLPQYPAILGFLVGAACIFMVSFDTAYRHLGRLFMYRRQSLLYTMPLYALILLCGWLMFGYGWVVVLILTINLLYALFPILVHLRDSGIAARAVRAQ